MDVRAVIKYSMSDILCGQSMYTEYSPFTMITVRTGHPVSRAVPISNETKMAKSVQAMNQNCSHCTKNVNQSIKSQYTFPDPWSTNTNQNDKENIPINIPIAQNVPMPQNNNSSSVLDVIHRFEVKRIWEEGLQDQWVKTGDDCEVWIGRNRITEELEIMGTEVSTGKVVLSHRYPAGVDITDDGLTVSWLRAHGNNLIACDFDTKDVAMDFLCLLIGMAREWCHQQKLEKFIVSGSATHKKTDGDRKYNELQLIELVEESGDYQLVYSQFMDSAQMKNEDLMEIYIYKINHQGRAAAHDHKREQILKSLGGDVSNLNEIGLYHGTQLDTLPMILHQGFLRQFVSRARYGQGIYFARDAKYSCDPTFATPDDDGFQHVLFCNVICGEWSKGESKMKVPPPKQRNEYLPHETTVDDEQDPSIFVTYQDDQALPIYLISFMC